MTFIGSKLGEGATCFSREGEFRRGDLRDVLMYEFAVISCCVTVFGCVSMLVV